MSVVKDYIESGILEMYVLGDVSADELQQVEQMALLHPEVAEEIEIIAASLETYSKYKAVEPDPIVKPFLLATIDYSERIKNGEEISFPPMLTEKSVIADFALWLNRKDITVPEKLQDVHAKIIGHTKEAITAIVWIKEMAPQEMHDDEIEKFLIVEGTCDIIIEDKVHQLKAGDMLSIPLYKNHLVKVTSSIPCKVILQRVAA
jgi:mannose-6-phosphate isomerase-like protein (cupin superfamily)